MGPVAFPLPAFLEQVYSGPEGGLNTTVLMQKFQVCGPSHRAGWLDYVAAAARDPEDPHLGHGDPAPLPEAVLAAQPLRQQAALYAAAGCLLC